MTNKEAIKILKNDDFNSNPRRYYEALAIAIKALEKQEKEAADNGDK